MLDPLTSLTIACAVAQFIDFGAKLIERADKISKSTDAAIPEVEELEHLVSTLKSLAHKLESARIVGEDEEPTEDACTEIALSEACKKLSQRIADSFQDIKIQGQPNKWDSLKLAYAISRKKKDIANYKMECDKLRAKLMEHLASNMCTSLLLLLYVFVLGISGACTRPLPPLSTCKAGRASAIGGARGLYVPSLTLRNRSSTIKACTRARQYEPSR